MRLQDEQMIVVSLIVATVAQFLTRGMITVALPTIRGHFEIGLDDSAWIMTTCLLAQVVMMPAYGRAGDLFGRRRTYLFALTFLILGALLSATSRSFYWLLAGRAMQGMGGAGLYALSVPLVLDTVAAQRQGRVLGLWQASIAGSNAVGPFIGGILIEQAGWRVVFYPAVLIGLLAVFLVSRCVPNVRGRGSAGEFDWGGLISLTVAATCILLALTKGSAANFMSRSNLTLLGVAGVSVALFMLVESHTTDPLLRLDMLTKPAFIIPAFGVSLRAFAWSSTLFLLPLFLAEVQHMRSSLIGFLVATASFLSFLTNPLGGILMDHCGSKLPVVVGMTLTTLSTLLFTQLEASSPAWFVVAGLAILGLSVGINAAAFAKGGISVFGEKRLGIAAGVYQMMRFSGHAFGPALNGSLLENKVAHYAPFSEGPIQAAAFVETFGWVSIAAVLSLAITFFWPEL